jgi:hypothetical protein
MAQATACLSPSGNRRNGRAHPYDRAKAMQWLLERCPTSDFPDLTDDTPAGRAAIVEMLRKVCVKMRAHGLRGEWHYSLPLHTELWRILQAEEAELAAIREELAAQCGTRGLPASSRGRPRRRAA